MVELQEKTEHGFFTAKRMLRLLLFLFVLALLVWGYNFTRLKELEISGLTRYTKEEFFSMTAEQLLQRNTFGYLISNRLATKDDIPFVESYEVEYLTLHTVRVQVHEKLVTGCVQLMGRFLYFDKDGIVVESSEERLSDIPLVTGLKFHEIVLYEPLTVQKQSLFQTILNLTRLIQEYEIKADQISFDSNYYVTLSCGSMEVLLGRRKVYDEQIAALQGILAAVGDRTGIVDMQNYSKEHQDVILKPSDGK